MNIYQSNTYIEDINWPHFDDEPRVQKRQQMKDQTSYISILVAYVTFPNSSYNYLSRNDNNIPCKTIWLIYRDTEQPQEKKIHRTNEGSNILRGSFRNRDQTKQVEFFQHWNQKATSCLNPVSCGSDSSSESIYSRCHRSDASSHSEKRVVS